MTTGTGTGTPITGTAQDYATLAQLKAQMAITDTTDDTRLSRLITSASRSLDKETGQFFYQQSSATYYYDAVDPDRVYLDNFASISAVAIDLDGSRQYATALTTSDYDLEPYNAGAELEPEPYTAIVRTPNATCYFPCVTSPLFSAALQLPSVLSSNATGRKAVKVTGVRGWAAVPSLITEACLLQAHRWFMRPSAIFGVIGSAEMGQVAVIAKLDPDIQMMVKNYRKLHFG